MNKTGIICFHVVYILNKGEDRQKKISKYVMSLVNKAFKIKESNDKE